MTTVRRASFFSVRVASFVKNTAGIAVLAAIVSAHIGSPTVFFTGKAGPYEVRVTIEPPQVVPGVARVTVRAPLDVQRVAIRPIFWRAGSKGAPSADEMRRPEGQSSEGGRAFEGSLWLMARGAYSVDVIVVGPRGEANVLVPIASVATGRLAMNPALGALLAALGLVLVAGLVTIAYKGAGESLLTTAEELDPIRRRRARRVGAIAIPIMGLAVFGGARWWGSVDRDYDQAMYRPSPLKLSLEGNALQLSATDPMWLPSRRVARILPDHGKMMHLFLVRADDARALAHLHPQPTDSTPNPPFRTRLPELPAGLYHVFGDVVHETGFERTLVGSIVLPDRPQSRSPTVASDPDDAWFVGDASRERTSPLADGSTMELDIVPNGPVTASTEVTFRIAVRDPAGKPARLEKYLGMNAHGVVVRVDGSVFVHLHPMGTVTQAAQEAFRARDRGDTTPAGRLLLQEHPAHAAASAPSDSTVSSVEFPYAFPKSGSYRLFAQVKRDGRVLTGAFAITVAEPTGATR